MYSGVRKPSGKIQLNKYMDEDITYNTHKSFYLGRKDIW